MKTICKRAPLYITALASLGLPLMLASGGAAAQDVPGGSVGNFNPPPCDYSDTFYEDNGLIPSQVVGRFGTSRRTGPPATGAQVNWVADSTCATNDPDRRNFRILATTGGFTDNGTPAANAFISILGFVTNDATFETTYSRAVGGSTISISDSQNPRGIAVHDIVTNFEAYAMVKQRLPNGAFARNPCQTDIAAPGVPLQPCFELNTVNTVYTPNLRQDWRFASNRNAMDGSDGNCINADPANCNPVNNAPYGYFCDDLLGMWIVTYVWYIVDPANPGAQCAADFAMIGATNGFSLDGTPIIKTPHETDDILEADGCAAEGQLDTGNDNGGAIFLVCPAIADPRNGAIAKDAFLDQVHLPSGAPQNAQMTANFLSLQRTGEFPGGGNGS